MNAILKPVADLDVFEMPIHPAADIFPMLDDDELHELANDIAENGLRQPLVITEVGGEWLLVDGRNRRAACKLVRVEPATEVLTGDPVEYILSANIHRRHMTKGQRAMAVAKICSVSEQSVRETSKQTGVTATRIACARTVLRYAPEQAEGVLSGAIPLDAAYEKAREAKAMAEGRDAVFAELKMRRADLADQVVEGRLTLEAATAAMKADEERERVARIATAKNLVDFRGGAAIPASEKNIAVAVDLIRNRPTEFKAATGMAVDEYLGCLETWAAKAKAILKGVKQ